MKTLNRTQPFAFAMDDSHPDHRTMCLVRFETVELDRNDEIDMGTHFEPLPFALAEMRVLERFILQLHGIGDGT